MIVSIPIKHHYNPEFYLSRWTGEDGRLCQFSRPNGVLVPNMRFPSQTGYQKRLYEMPDLPADKAQQVELLFMQPLDTMAAEALVCLDNDDPRMRQDPKLRSAWSRFIMSMMLRAPEAIEALKQGVATQWRKSIPALEERYEQVRGDSDPATFTEYLAKHGNNTDGWAMSLAPKLIDHALIGNMLNNMRWFVRRISSAEGEFLTSDRPVVMSWTLTEENAFLLFPIGPKAMFVAVNDVATQGLIEEREPGEQVRAWNQLLAGRAVRFVYARDDLVLPFVAEHIGKHQRPTLLEQIAERYARQTS